jgi:hypothetical protein
MPNAERRTPTRLNADCRKIFEPPHHTVRGVHGVDPCAAFPVSVCYA